MDGKTSLLSIKGKLPSLYTSAAQGLLSAGLTTHFTMIKLLLQEWNKKREKPYYAFDFFDIY